MKYSAVTSLVLAGLWATVAGAQPDAAQDSDSLRTEIDALRARLDELEAQSEAANTDDDGDRMRFSGDFRYRHETIDDDLFRKRSRHRIRARVRFDADVADNVAVNVTLATGGSNPVSANQTLGDGFSRKDIGVDRAFFDWSISDSVNLLGGKMANPMHRAGGHHLVYDSDLNPEGLALSFESGRLFANLAGFMAKERGGDADSILTALQGGIRPSVGGAELTFGISYYDYSNTKGFAPFYLGIGGGNSLDANGNFLYDYKTVELFAEVALDAFGQPLTLFVDAVKNTEVDNYDQGFAVGARFRRASNPGDWEFRWAYQDLEADAVMAIFSDSDFGGGGTDSRGHVFRGTYVLPNGVGLAGSLFINERGEAAGMLRDYKRLQLDANFRF